MDDSLTVLVDMDGVLVDFMGGWIREWNRTHPDKQADPTKEFESFYVEECFADLGTEAELTAVFNKPGFFYDLEPLPGALEAFKQMNACGIDLFLCTAPTKRAHCWQEKADWVEHYLGPEWCRRLIITKDKTMVAGDYLIDDKPEIDGYYKNPAWEHIYLDQPYNQTGSPTRFRITWKTWPTLLIYHASKK